MTEKQEDVITMGGETFQMKELTPTIRYFAEQIKALNIKERGATMELDAIKTAKNAYTQELSKQLSAIAQARNVAAGEAVDIKSKMKAAKT